MLIEFTTENFLSIREKISLSMLAVKQLKELEESNIHLEGKYPLLKSAVIYGANASGKSNVLAAMRFMKWFVMNSSKESQVLEKIPIIKHKLYTKCKKKPSFFEIIFLIKNFKYRYGFEASENGIKTEWLFQVKRIKETPLFLRQKDAIEVMKDFNEGKNLEAKTRNNALFLSVVAQFNGNISTQILNWFNGFRIISGLDDNAYSHVSAKMLEDEDLREFIVSFLRKADIGIEDINVKIEKLDTSELFEYLSQKAKDKFLSQGKGDEQNVYTVVTKHPIYNEKGKVIGSQSLDLEGEESEGTKKFFNLIGPIIDSILYGYVFIVDELDARLHPLLTLALLKVFNSTKNITSQFIFATHDTTLLRKKVLRRDQIWFTEKDKRGATDLYSLAEYKLPSGTVRKDASYENDYIKGKYGAIPFIGDFSSLLEQGNGKKEKNR